MSYNFPHDQEQKAVPVEVSAGSIFFFNGYLLHKSQPNSAPAGTFRRVPVNHYLSASSILPRGRRDFRDIVLIAGEDPYARKGTGDLHGVGVRSAGNGGCGDGRVDLKNTFRNHSATASTTSRPLVSGA